MVQHGTTANVHWRRAHAKQPKRARVLVLAAFRYLRMLRCILGVHRVAPQELMWRFVHETTPPLRACRRMLGKGRGIVASTINMKRSKHASCRTNSTRTEEQVKRMGRGHSGVTRGWERIGATVQQRRIGGSGQLCRENVGQVPAHAQDMRAHFHPTHPCTHTQRKVR